MSQNPENNRNSIGRFVQGSSVNPNVQPVGSKSKYATLRAAFIEAFEEIGRVETCLNGHDAIRLSFIKCWQG
jgi:hypothetical protein